jgi:hypothetical protein
MLDGLRLTAYGLRPTVDGKNCGANVQRSANFAAEFLPSTAYTQLEMVCEKSHAIQMSRILKFPNSENSPILKILIHGLLRNT